MKYIWCCICTVLCAHDTNASRSYNIDLHDGLYQKPTLRKYEKDPITYDTNEKSRTGNLDLWTMKDLYNYMCCFLTYMNINGKHDAVISVEIAEFIHICVPINEYSNMKWLDMVSISLQSQYIMLLKVINDMLAIDQNLDVRGISLMTTTVKGAVGVRLDYVIDYSIQYSKWWEILFPDIDKRKLSTVGLWMIHGPIFVGINALVYLCHLIHFDVQCFYDSKKYGIIGVNLNVLQMYDSYPWIDKSVYHNENTCAILYRYQAHEVIIGVLDITEDGIYFMPCLTHLPKGVRLQYKFHFGSYYVKIFISKNAQGEGEYTGGLTFGSVKQKYISEYFNCYA